MVSAVVLAAAVLSGCKSTSSAPNAPANVGAGQQTSAASGATPQSPLTGSAALQVLSQLPIKAAGSMNGYSRDQFGSAWTDDNNAPGGHNKCDTRDDILRRDLVDVKPATGCQIESGTLHDVYTGKSIDFVRGPKSSVVQIDHMVPLGNAWITGAQGLSADKRKDLANDPRNLEAVDGPTNEAKGDSDAAAWLPPQQSYRCTYVERQVNVKQIYGLWVTQAEHDAMATLLKSC